MLIQLAGRQASGRPLPYDELEQERRQPGLCALPPLCYRNLQSGKGCNTQCPGVQSDGGCLAELVKGRNGWEVEIDRDGVWCLLER